MDDNTQLWSGVALLVVGAIVLFGPFVLGIQHTTVLLTVAVLGLAAGALLIGLSRRGRAV